ncbi:hypothetical protein GTP91_17335 [Rugamonas sp. FT82W]|uniref:Uncharacterized protein n=1 Tax=Duganella vulcania TaxID=2692166 RepID=A0A845G5J6_9BURK|nr:hypothetical protein [Duganella vulcania]MYM88930.1 hypothetical protein [Duganella vulcania]
MRKPRVFVPDDFVSSDDYKLWYSEMETKNNYESLYGWIYLGADAKNKKFAKIGLSMGDLSSRSYSSSNPNYYLFCAFKCRHDISRDRLAIIEREILTKIDELYKNRNGSSRRMRHYESGALSECFESVDFFNFFKDLHSEIYENYRNDFVTSEWWEDHSVESEGSFVDCIFNPKISLKEKNTFIRMILQYE